MCSLIARGIVAAAPCATVRGVTAELRALDRSIDPPACDAIVAGLPAWFGNAEGIAECRQAVRTHEGLVAVEADRVVGFLTHERRRSRSTELTWMAVRADRHGCGIGSELIERFLSALPHDGLVVVKTLSDRDGDPGPEYAATRAFYLARGFRPMAELDIWGSENPCQLLGRRIRPGPS